MKYVMSDGRSVGEFWGPNCSLNAILQRKFDTPNLDAYRYYLQNNAIKVMKELEPENQNRCKICPICQQALAYKPLGHILQNLKDLQ